MTVTHVRTHEDFLAYASGRRARDIPGDKGRTSLLAGALATLHNHAPSRPLKAWLFNRITALEGGDMYSATARRILREKKDCEVGLYSDCTYRLTSGFPNGLTIGRYCSIAETVAFLTMPDEARILNVLGLPESPPKPPTLGHDVWIGHNAVISGACNSIGTGAIIAANSLVITTVPPYAVVAGNPARVVRYRFPQALIEKLLASAWWELAIEDLDGWQDVLCKPIAPSLRA